MSTKPTPDTRPRFPWLLTVFCALGVAALMTLGVWQVKRLAWKEGLIAASEAAAQQPPVSMTALPTLPEPEFRRVVLDCDFQDRPYVELHSIHDGEPGVRLISSCDGWLVDLGFVSETISARPARMAAAVPAITAQVRRVPVPNVFAPPPEGNLFFARDNAAMMQALGQTGPVRPYVLFAESSAWPQWQAIRPGPPPVAFSNNHLGYALTWFGLAAALGAMWVAMVLRGRRR
jgi:Uncharacterized conserved protein